VALTRDLDRLLPAIGEEVGDEEEDRAAARDLREEVETLTRSTWRRPFFGGTYFSTLSVTMYIPTRSLFLIAENATTAASSAASSRFAVPCEPKYSEALMSTMRLTVRSRSSTNCLTCGAFMRAVMFQSIERTSSPG
jgi:hypothetical protein